MSGDDKKPTFLGVPISVIPGLPDDTAIIGVDLSSKPDMSGVVVVKNIGGFGSPTGRLRRSPEQKVIDYGRLYAASEITIARRVGQYPLPSTDFAALEMRVLARMAEDRKESDDA